MCGIAGYWLPGTRRDPREVLAALCDALAHRGPDGEGTWVDEAGGIGLGHRRLAVIAPGDEGRQPMVSRSGRWVVTFNGEIYNAPELAERLAAGGRRLRGGSDTEVLVEAVDAWGPEAALAELDAMFAFAAWDREERRLVLARDRLGEKPLVYAPLEGGLLFASELGALRAVDGFDAAVDPEAVALFLRFKYVPAPWTIHRGARKLEAGHLLEVRDGRIGEPIPYWSLADEVAAGAADPLDAAEVLDRLDGALTSSIRRRLRSDVPLGALLSGGIDSTLVATLAAEQLDRPLATFTIGSDDRDHDEAGHARAVASRLGAEHTELVVTAGDALAEVPDLAGHWDEPFADSSQLPTLLVSRLARRSVTVVLSGDGGDELFGGYNRHLWLPRTWDRVGSLPGPVRRGAGRLLGSPRPATWDRAARLVPERRRPRLLGLKVDKLAGVLAAEDRAAAYGRLVSHWQDPGPLAGVDAEPVTLTHRQDRWPAAPTFAEQLMAVDALTYLPDDVLVKVDRASMAHGLEARVPLLAPEVVALSTRMPIETKIRAGVGKWALRELIARRHPRELIDRPKSGFGVPIAAWLRGPLRPWAEDLLAARSLRDGGLVDPTPVRAAWADHLGERRDRSYELWDVLMLASWQSSIAR